MKKFRPDIQTECERFQLLLLALKKNKFGELNINCALFSLTKRVKLSNRASIHPSYRKHELKKVSKDFSF